jgi:hypothetical protein
LTRPAPGWKQLLPPGPWYRRPGAYPIPAYSEFMPPPRLGRRAYGGSRDPVLFAADDPWGWRVTEYEETFELQPGLAHVAGHLLAALERLGHCRGGHGIGRLELRHNPFWPEPLASGGAPPQERFLALAPLALARTQDDKGRVRWTLFGASEQGPARPFWRGFFRAPGEETDAAAALAFCRRLTGAGESQASPWPRAATAIRDLLALGFRVLPGGLEGWHGSWGETGDGRELCEIDFWRDEPLPSWTAPLRWREDQPLTEVRYLLTFRPFAGLPEPVRRAYLDGKLQLLPFPGSLLFWGVPAYRALGRELPLALQIPLLHPIERSENVHRLRVPQSGWLREPRPGQPEPETEHAPIHNTFRRTHRWQRIERHEDALAVAGHEDRMAHVLFSAAADELGLYGKPMARNSQIWSQGYHLVLDGPPADRAQVAAAAARLLAGGTFGYRFLYPAMQVGYHQVYWHRPLAAVAGAGGGAATLIEGAPLGFLTAYDAEHPDLSRPVELWPRLLDRPAHRAALQELRREVATATAGLRSDAARARAAAGAAAAAWHRAVLNARKLLDACQLLGGEPLPESFAGALVRLRRSGVAGPRAGARGRASRAGGRAGGPGGPETERAAERNDGTLAAWLQELEEGGKPAGAATSGLAGELRARIAFAPAAAAEPRALTFHHTARRRFEQQYWRRIEFLAAGRFLNKDNADVVRDPVTLAQLRHTWRDLDPLGDYLLSHYRRLIAARGMEGHAFVGDLPFRWQTDFDFSWSGGWLGNQQGHLEERDLLVVIPGRDRGRAVIMADHYDTAYMEDRYGYQHGGHGPRIAAAGADDNHSATAALMLAAPIFLEMSRAGQLGCDVWLVHLTGEEFPSDCLGARHLTQSLVEGTLRLRTREGAAPLPRQAAAVASGAADGWLDLAATRVQGVYVLDMVAHNNDRERDVFQICPGAGGQSMWLALQAHLANHTWNQLAPGWNRRARRGRGRGRRSADGRTLPALALHPQLRGEVRPQIDPRSTLYNTDGQIFSDAGVPAVLFMENYDINRHGYHDSHDTMENIDLDYGAALAAIAIETVARAATAPAPPARSKE